jgi:hypothetical protein
MLDTSCIFLSISDPKSRLRVSLQKNSSSLVCEVADGAIVIMKTLNWGRLLRSDKEAMNSCEMGDKGERISMLYLYFEKEGS